VLVGGNALIVSALDDAARAAPLLAAGAAWWRLPDAKGKRVDLAALLLELGRYGINELHVEAGATLSGSLIAGNLADELLLYLAPVLLGDTARGMFALPQLPGLAASPRLTIRRIDPVGEDWRVLARFASPP
jgi:diaminohydroxyphosphoribosylaminopyrimidine deaminase/5-amino-6-(5-phosphoribosylamino)uracil reductase